MQTTRILITVVVLGSWAPQTWCQDSPTPSPTPISSPAPTPDTSVKTEAAWFAYVNGDARLTSILTKIGKADVERSGDDPGTLLYTWWNRVDNDTTQKEDLKLIVAPYQGSMIVVGILDPTNGETTSFPWADKVMSAILPPGN